MWWKKYRIKKRNVGQEVIVIAFNPHIQESEAGEDMGKTIEIIEDMNTLSSKCWYLFNSSSSEGV